MDKPEYSRSADGKSVMPKNPPTLIVALAYDAGQIAATLAKDPEAARLLPSFHEICRRAGVLSVDR